MFLDMEEYLADRIFIKHKVNVKFGKEYAQKGSKYLCIFCRIRKRDDKKFKDALEELKNSMLLYGYRDYEEFCIRMMNLEKK